MTVSRRPVIADLLPAPRRPRVRVLALIAPLVLLVAPRATQAQPAAAPADRPTALTLGGAARIAARQSAPAEEARLRAAQASARVTQHRAELLPQLSLDASDGARTFNTASFGLDFPAQPGQPPLFDPNGQVEGPVRTYDLRGRATQNLLDLGAVGRVRAARADARADDADAADAADRAAGVAALAYVRAARADAQLRNRVADSALAADLLRIAEQQLRAGTGVALDVTRARSQLAAARALLIAARNESDRARLDLRRALGLPVDAPVGLADSLEALPLDVPVPDEVDATQQAIARRPDLRAAAEQVAAAERGVGAIRAERLPTVSLFVDQGATGKNTAHLLNTSTWGVQASLPLFDGFRREGRMEEQRAVAAERAVRRRDLERQAATEVRGALLDLRAAREQVEATRERLALAEQEVAQARERFRAGVASNADVVTASQSLYAARTAHADALAGYQTARVALARAQGAVTELR